ncbi:acylphosphatase [Methylobacterium sp. PvP062]|jgi:acylphosphatase|uniref:acylphosphatase n=2 Tax=Methylobacterium radiotolerans TaxID=31998 RepID=B1M314_METRJ|nr:MULTISPECIES: acylphosphatase [Methylobacterium]MCX7332190.1 acylphosphatase [Hyphomicrobiales bacterium]GAN48436.1 acylphosphatase [Methylobacterium sp. ME121]ACB24730.1 acylphosphatase [Methylobacterium radiotolerans JCM 2831]KIU32689.1 acylphosphatase [Methylobacterium radiotolerans]KTS10962.1 acylphosphatase [Methylobacterium radiotolerans]
MSETRTISVIVTGRVQGVSYRAWTQSEARARGLAGTVRNRDDGSVEAVFSGAPEAVAEMEALCRSGPPGARVADVTARDGGDVPTGGAFRILRD